MNQTSLEEPEIVNESTNTASDYRSGVTLPGDGGHVYLPVGLYCCFITAPNGGLSTGKLQESRALEPAGDSSWNTVSTCKASSLISLNGDCHIRFLQDEIGCGLEAKVMLDPVHLRKADQVETEGLYWSVSESRDPLKKTRPHPWRFRFNWSWREWNWPSWKKRTGTIGGRTGVSRYQITTLLFANVSISWFRGISDSVFWEWYKQNHDKFGRKLGR